MMKRLSILLLGLVTLAACSLSPQGETQIQAPTQEPSSNTQPTEIPVITPLFPTSTPADHLLDEIQELTERRKSDLSEAGWLHIISRRSAGEGNPVEGAEELTPPYDQHEWLYLDESGQVTRAVVQVVDAVWRPLQTRVMVNGFWHDLSSGAVSQVNSIDDFPLGVGVYDQAKDLVGSDQQLNKQTLYQNCWYIGEQYTISDGKLMRYVVIDPDNAQLRAVKIMDISSGSFKMVDSLEVLKEERVSQPPDEVLAFFSQVPAQE
jgi:hypothetical protein